MTSTTVVTLSRNADSTAVTSERIMSRAIGRPCDRATERMAIHSKNPVFTSTEAITIIPASRKMTSRLIAAKASCSSRMPSATSIRPAMTAVMVRSGFSIAIRT